jgi:predicted O-methyltransferase YrrM
MKNIGITFRPASVRIFSQWLKLCILVAKKRIVANTPNLYSELLEACSLHISESELSIFDRLFSIRQTLNRNRTEINVVDYGSGRDGNLSSAGNSHNITSRKIAEIYRTSSASHSHALFIYKLACYLKPQHVLELGTNLGVSACYLRATLDSIGVQSHLTTIEGDPQLAKIAHNNLRQISEAPVEVLVGRFSDVLPTLVSSQRFDFVFIDGHHAEQPTLEYFSMIKPSLAENYCVIFDDIYFGSQVRKAWKRIVRETPEALALDFASYGVLIKRQT